jgi:murein DD-endopeptidase MepM/ murein hydrolase activator NlpD
MPPITCVVCGNEIGDGERFVLVRERRNESYCSETCLVVNANRRRRIRAAVRRRWFLRGATLLLLVAAAPKVWHRFRLPRPEMLVFEPPEFRPAPPPRPEPIYYGPAWPPTDDDWLKAFASTTWAYPLPGPGRRAPAPDDRVLAGRPSSGRQPAICRTAGRCGVDIGGELWGEHVYAVHDGVVDHIQRAFGDEKGDVYLRLSHFGGMVFTHYFHLAAVPRGIARGTVVRAGELIGLVGDTGNEHPGRYVHFALSIRPSAELPEVFWDPTPLMADWPLRVPTHGTVAGFVPSETDLLAPPFRRRPR